MSWWFIFASLSLCALIQAQEINSNPLLHNRNKRAAHFGDVNKPGECDVDVSQCWHDHVYYFCPELCKDECEDGPNYCQEYKEIVCRNNVYIDLCRRTCGLCPDSQCEYEGESYAVGETVKHFPDTCAYLKCMPDYSLKEFSTFEHNATKCCVCHNAQYGHWTPQCKYKLETGECPVPCYKDREVYAHGSVLETNLEKCSKTQCLNGEIITEHKFGEAMTGCCEEKTPTITRMVIPGTSVTNGGCVPLKCKDTQWHPHSSQIVRDCPKCNLQNDPHVFAFSKAIFDWQKQCNHALIQQGRSLKPIFGVFMDFIQKGRWTAVGPTTYQEDRRTKVLINPRNPNQLTVNGYDQTITSTTPTALVGPSGSKSTAMAWKRGRCVRIYGKPQILVEVCASGISMWAPKEGPHSDPISGLCGSTNEQALKEKQLVDREGNKWKNPGGYISAAAEFGYSWQALDQTKEGCPVTEYSMRSKRDIDLEDLAEHEREKCLDVATSQYVAQCHQAIGESGLEGPDFDEQLNMCLFDLCLVTNDPENVTTADEMLSEHKEIAAATKDQNDNTVDSLPVETKCPTGWSPVGDQCYQVYPFSEGASFDDAMMICKIKNGSLAQPRDQIAFKTFLRGALPKTGTIDNDMYWIGGRFEDGAMRYLSGNGVISNEKIMTKPAPSNNNHCLLLYPYIPGNYIPLLYENCLETKGYVCETEALPCDDEDDNCSWRAADGECEPNKAYMHKFCKASCNVPCDIEM